MLLQDFCLFFGQQVEEPEEPEGHESREVQDRMQSSGRHNQAVIPSPQRKWRACSRNQWVCSMLRMESENLAAIVYWGGKRGGAITSKCTEQSKGIQGPGGPGPSGLAVPLTLRCSLAGAQGRRAYSGRGRGAQCCDILQNVALLIRCMLLCTNALGAYLPCRRGP